VTRFEKTWLPNTQFQTYDFARNGLLAQYTIIFHYVPCSKISTPVFVAAYQRLCVSLRWCFGAIGWSWLSWVSHEWLANFVYPQLGIL